MALSFGAFTALSQMIATNQFGIAGNYHFLDSGASDYPIRLYRHAMP